MPVRQSSLPQKKVNRFPKFDELAIGRVTSVTDYDKYGRIEVIFLNYGQPAPVWCFGDLDREPVQGDMVLIGFIEGRKDTPYLAGFQKNGSYSTNFIQVRKDTIRLQLPVFQIGQKNGIADTDTKGHLLDDSRRDQRAMVELTTSSVNIQFPFDASQKPAYITIDSKGVHVSHPTGDYTFGSGSKGVARQGDQVTVNVNGTNYTGSITSASSKVMID